MAKPARQAIVEVELNDGRKARHHAKAVRGTPDNPMTTAEIEAKAIDLIAPISGDGEGEAAGGGDRQALVAALRARIAHAAAGVALRLERNEHTRHKDGGSLSPFFTGRGGGEGHA